MTSMGRGEGVCMTSNDEECMKEHDKGEGEVV